MKYLENGSPLVFRKEMAEILGSLNEAIFLSQLKFLIDASKVNGAKGSNTYKYQDGYWWNYNSYQSWQKDHFPFWGINTIRRIVESLEDKDIIISRQPQGWNRMKWYTINIKKVEELEQEYDAQKEFALLKTIAEEHEKGNDVIPDEPDDIVGDDVGDFAEDDSIVGDDVGDDDFSLPSAQNGHMHLPKMGKPSAQNEHIRCAQNGQTSYIKNTTYIKTFSPQVASLENKSDHRGNNNVSEYESDDDEYSEELNYVETDDEGNEIISNSWRRPKWMSPTSELCTRALEITGRKWFRSKPERSNWIAIEKSILPYAINSAGKHPKEWVEEVLNWVESKNRDSLRSNGPMVITFPKLLSTLNNETLLVDWRAKRARQGKDTDISSKDFYNLPDEERERLIRENDERRAMSR